MIDLIAIDAGNSRVKCARCLGGQMVEFHVYDTADIAAEADWLSAWPEPVVLASVVPKVTRAVARWCARTKRRLVHVTSQSQTVIDTIKPLGADLLAASVAAVTLYAQKQPVMVIGLGTASTLTAVTAKRKLHGCQFALGLAGSLKALSERCALLEAIPPDFKDVSIAQDTEGAMLNGTLSAQVGLVERWLKQGRAELGKDLVVVVTGGAASTILPHLLPCRARTAISWEMSPLTIKVGRSNVLVDQQLTLKGIHMIGQELLSPPIA